MGMDMGLSGRVVASDHGIDHFQESEAMEIGVAGINTTDSVFSHQNGGVGIVQDVTRAVRAVP